MILRDGHGQPCSKSNIKRRRKRSERGRFAGQRLMFEALEIRALLAVDATLALGRATLEGSVAHFEVEINYAATGGEKLAFFSLDAQNSSASLIGPGSDFSAFSFVKASPLLDDWSQIGFFNDAGFESTVEFDDSLIAPLSTGVYALGTLSVDFGAAGLSFGDIFTVSLDSVDTVIGVEDDSGFRFEPVNFNSGTRTVVPVSLSGPATVDEGDDYSLTIDTLVTSGIDLIIDWGDGQQDTLDVADLPTDRQVTHVYADGDADYTILVDVEDQHGTRASAGNVDVVVENVAPTVVLSGDPSVDEGTLYTLTIGEVQDPGDDTVTDYFIDWGDGHQSSIAAVDLPADRTVTHTYADGVAFTSIVVDLVDEDGTHPDAGLLAVTVNNVSPTIELTGAASTDEGAVYTLTIGAVDEPGDDTVSEYIIHWGDGEVQSILAADFPANGEVPHIYTDGDTSVLISVDLVDDDSTHLNAGTLEVVVNNVAPTLTLTGAASVNEGSSYTLNFGAVVDPGDDTVTQYLVNWGDGEVEEINAAELPASRNVTHTFADGVTSPVIAVEVVDEDGTHSIGSLGVTVNNVAPTVTLSGAASVYEGATYTLTLESVIDPGEDTVSHYIVHWGDGDTETIEAADLPANHQVTHAYADGPSSASIVVDLVDEDGTYLSAGALNVAVNNVAPTIALIGAASVQEGSAYTLTLGAVTDPGQDTVTQYTIHWGDGQHTIIDAEDLPANRQIDHTYADGPHAALIIVDLVDEDGTHTATGSLAITVNDVAETILLTGASSVAEGSPYTLTLGEVDDPGTDIVSQYIIHWGDGQQTTIDAEDLPANRQVEHTYADGSLTALILADLVDEDGTHPAVGSLAVQVNNVAPTVALTGAATVEEGALYTLTLGAVSDPGTDTVSQYSIHWGDGQHTILNATDLPVSRQVTHIYPDNRAANIAVDLTDEDGNFPNAGSKSITVTNVAPTIVSITNTTSECVGGSGSASSGGGGEAVREGHAMSIAVSFSDPGFDSPPGASVENFTAMIDWGDGTQQPAGQITLTETPGGPGVPTQGTVAASHTYADGGIYRITVKLYDDDGAFDAETTTAMIIGAGVNRGVLQVVGTELADLVTINKQANNLFKVHADFFDSVNFKTFPTTGVQLINVMLCGGDDHLNLAGNIATTAILDGGPGIDHINANGNTNALIVDDGQLPSSSTDLGTVDFESVPNINLATADRLYRFDAMYTGTLTLDATFMASQGSGQIVLLDSNGRVLASSTPVSGGQRVDNQATAGETFYALLIGSNPNVNLTIVNMITQNSPLTVHGTTGDDQFEFIAGEVLQLRVNGVDYQYDPTRIESVTFLGNGGADSIILQAPSAEDAVSLLEQAAELLGDNYAAFVKNVDSIEVRDTQSRPLLQNPTQATDVNEDGILAPGDVLLVINWLNTYGSETVVDALTSVPPGTLSGKYDVNGDGTLSALDALLVINALNREWNQGGGGAEGEVAESANVESTPLQSANVLTISIAGPVQSGSQSNSSAFSNPQDGNEAEVMANWPEPESENEPANIADDDVSQSACDSLFATLGEERDTLRNDLL